MLEPTDLARAPGSRPGAGPARRARRPQWGTGGCRSRRPGPCAAWAVAFRRVIGFQLVHRKIAFQELRFSAPTPLLDLMLSH